MPEVLRRAGMRAGVACAGLVIGLGLFAPMAPARAEPGSEGSASLTDDSGGVALFDATSPLLPGERRSACLSVAAGGTGPGDVVVFATRDVRGDLGGSLRLQVDAGDGGGRGSCAGFVGSTLFTGTLAGLDVAATEGLNTGWHPTTDPVRTFRITVGLPEGATTGGTAGASFVWRLVQSEVAPPPPATDPTPDVTVDPTPDPVGPVGPVTPVDPTPGPTNTSDDGVPAPMRPTSGPPSSSGTGASDGTARPGGDDPAAPDVLLQGGTAAAKTLRTVQAMAESPQSLLLPAAVAVGFLLVQRRIDRRDPKLVAAARSSRDLEVAFPDPLARGWGSSP